MSVWNVEAMVNGPLRKTEASTGSKGYSLQFVEENGDKHFLNCYFSEKVDNNGELIGWRFADAMFRKLGWDKARCERKAFQPEQGQKVELELTTNEYTGKPQVNNIHIEPQDDTGY